MNDNSEFVFKFDGDKVTISLKAYKSILKTNEFKLYLEAYGVDNWQAYYDALNDVDEIFGQSYHEVCKAIDAL